MEAMSAMQPEGGTAVLDEVEATRQTAPAWVTIVWDDPVNLQAYVTHVFCSYFHYPKEKAQELMLQVHNDGKAVVATGSLEEMERDVNAMHSYGLWATLDRAR